MATGSKYWITSGGEIIVENRYGVSLRKKKTTNCGYQEVNLYLDGAYKYKTVHRLVAEAFLPNPQKKGCVCHLDGNKQNNCVENLYWGTQSENMLDHYKSGGKVTWGELANKKLKEKDVRQILRMLKDGVTQSKVAARFGVTQSHISRLSTGEVWGRLTKTLC